MFLKMIYKIIDGAINTCMYLVLIRKADGTEKKSMLLWDKIALIESTII